jgi:hypothetical protein
MEKLKPHYDLKKVKSLLCSEETREVTRISREGAVSLGYMGVEDMVSIIKIITPKHFFKSMTNQYNPSLWQDVYKITDERDNKIYIKLQLSSNKKKGVIIQFKEDTGGGG